MSKKLKEKETEISKLTESLHFHTEGNRELKEHLDAALNEETIAKIEQRISKYKTERDTTKEAMKTLRASCDEQLSLKESTILSLREELLKYQEEKQAWAVKYKKRKSELSELKKGSKEAIAKLHSQLQEKEQLLQSLAAHDTDRDDDDDDDDDDGGGNSDANQEAEYVHVSNEEEMEEDNELYLTAVNDSFQSGPSVPTTKHSTDIKQKTSPSLSRHTRSSIHKSSKEAIPCHTHLRGASKATTSTSSQVIVRTKTGEKQSVIVPGVLEEMPIGSIVVVKRKDGIYEQGLLRYVGKEQCGVELELPSMLNTEKEQMVKIMMEPIKMVNAIFTGKD
uniref:Uncharacterized protein n=1 Tax=Amphimedon queenslandica TaxID=400682 RepID=A0A1X7SQN0_AMPQE